MLLILLAGIAQSVQRLAMGSKVRGSNPGGGEIFRTSPDRPWGQPSFLYNGNGSSRRVKRPGSGVEQPLPSSAEVKERVELYLFSPSGPSWPVLGWTVLLLNLLDSIVVSKTPTSVRKMAREWDRPQRTFTSSLDRRSVLVGFAVDKVAMGQVSLQVLLFYSVNNILSVLYTQLNLHLDVVPTWEVEGRSLGIIQKEMLFRKSLSIG
jgi:hypothetical protein